MSSVRESPYITWRKRSGDRLSDAQWQMMLMRVRGEFAEMPCMRVTLDQAGALFGLAEPASRWILDRLAADGFLTRTPQGEYVKRSTAP